MAEQKRQSYRLEVNAPITVVLNDLGRQLKPELVDISESGCRIRAGVKLPPQTRISFNWLGPSREPIAVHGRVVAARMTDAKTAEYGVQFEMPVAQRDHLARELAEIQRRKAYKPTDPVANAPQPEDGELGGRAKRQAYRAGVSFPVSVKANKEGRWTIMSGEANDLSEGGLLLALPQELPDGTELEIAFNLPFGAVNMGGEEREVVEVGPFGERKTKQLVPVRPFDRIETKARIVKKVGGSRNGKPQFGVGFVELPAFVGEEIARYVHAYQLTQLRKAAANQA
ncbi:MAG: PilZ domain-containing protein [Candidatus Eremiobacteraeota bacterium]|nr:PilZ domain-containing protein [Candidatus Eremiobacteraeota bacterium]